MLDKSLLKDDIQGALEESLPAALEQCIKDTFPESSKVGDEMAKKFRALRGSAVWRSVDNHHRS